MPDESPAYFEEEKSFILVHQQTLVQFNAILVETSLNADEQLHQFFQIYQCIKTTLTVSKQKKKVNSIDYFLSQLKDFKRYVLAFTREHKDEVATSAPSTTRRTRSQAKQHIPKTDIPNTVPAQLLEAENDDNSGNAEDNHDEADFEKPKGDKIYSSPPNEPPDKTFVNIDTSKADANTEESLTLTSDRTVQNKDTCKEMTEARSDKLDKKSKKMKRKRKVSKELSVDSVNENLSKHIKIKVKQLPASPTSERDEKSKQVLSVVKTKVKMTKKTASFECNSSTASNQVVEKVMCKMENGKYVCEHCSYKTTRKYNMERHIFKHYEKPVCRICNTTFVDSSHLKTHMVAAHGQSGDAKACCSLCGENFLSLNALRKHKQFVHLRKAKYHCEVCDIFFDSRSRFDAHMWKHTGVAPHRCGKCGKEYRFKKNLLHHTLICTGKNVPYEKKDGRLHCRECGYSTRWYTDIKRHGYQHNPQDKHACSRCEKSYCSVLELQEHVNTAHLNLKFLCYGCGKKFNSRRALNRHANHAHENIYKYTCEICDKRFYDKVKFDDHKDKHTGAKNHVCHVCGLAYRYKPRLITHLKMHASTEEIVCNICSQKFNTTATLKNHMIGKHSVDRYYRCPWCSKEFRWSSSLSFHKRKTCPFQPMFEIT